MRIPCKTDKDCTVEYYCYETSHICIEFINCKTYNREEAKVPARDIFQCGPCLNGFSTNNSTGVSELHCMKIPNPTIDPETHLDIIWLIAMLICTATLCMIFLAFICIKKRLVRFIIPQNEKYSKNLDEQNVVLHNENTNKNVKPSAPSEEVYECNHLVKNKKCSVHPFTYNNEAKMNEKQQKATAWCSPSWVTNANLSNETNNNDAEYSVERNRVSRASRLLATRNNFDTDRQLNILTPEQTVEHEDNVRNNAVVLIDSATTNDNDSDTDSLDSFTTQHDNNNQSRNRKDRTKIKTVLINQNIKMEVNVMN